jgi:hypothetical protein
MNKEKTISIIMGIMAVIMIILTGILILNHQSVSFIEFYADRDWQGVHEIKGDFSGEIDCEKMWQDNFANGKWAEKCSVTSWFGELSCHWICVEDCKLQNKEEGKNVCDC